MNVTDSGNVAIWKEVRGGEKEQQEEECGAGKEGDEEGVMCTTAAMWWVGSHTELKPVWCSNDTLSPKHTHLFCAVRYPARFIGLFYK